MHVTGDVGAGHIARMLSQSGSLVSLFLRNNSIGLDGTHFVLTFFFRAHKFFQSGSLISLFLRNNSMGLGGMRIIFGALVFAFWFSKYSFHFYVHGTNDCAKRRAYLSSPVQQPY